MSVLVSSLTNLHHHSNYFSNNSTRRINENLIQTKQNRSITKKLNVQDQTDDDHVPYGVVNSMKQRLLNKVNEAYLLNNNNNNNNNNNHSNNNNNSSLLRNSLSKQPSARLSSNENLLQNNKTNSSPLKHTTRLSRSQDNLTNNHFISNHSEQFNSYIQPKQDVIIVDTTTTNEEFIQENEKLSAGQKTSTHRQSYTELHVDEAPKPGIFNFFLWPLKT